MSFVPTHGNSESIEFLSAKMIQNFSAVKSKTRKKNLKKRNIISQFCAQGFICPIIYLGLLFIRRNRYEMKIKTAKNLGFRFLFSYNLFHDGFTLSIQYM